MTPQPLLALVGPTATGKSDVGLLVAEALGAEIVCVDSMTVYRGMDIGTAKPTEADRARVPHHLLDILEPDEDSTVARFKERADAVIAEIRARGQTPLLVGGSGLYYQAIVDDLSFPPSDPAVRRRLEREETDVLVERLAARDPVAVNVTEGNRRRVVRALEVIEVTGEPFSSFQEGLGRRDDPAWAGRVRAAALDLPNEALRARVEARARAMVDAGLLDEVTGLLARGFRTPLTASQAVGYREAVAVIEGRATVDELIERIVGSTMRLVRKQRVWFKRDPRIRWFTPTERSDTGDEIRAYFSAG